MPLLVVNSNSLRNWWNQLKEIGPLYGYFVNPTKTWLIVKEEHMSSATYLFHKEGIRSPYREESTWVQPSDPDPSQRNMSHQKLLASCVKEMEKLTTFVSSQPHAAYAAIAHGLSGKWTHLARTVLGTSDLLKPLEEVIRHRFIPAL